MLIVGSILVLGLALPAALWVIGWIWPRSEQSADMEERVRDARRRGRDNWR